MENTSFRALVVEERNGSFVREIKSIQPKGTVTCCGNVASPKLELTVFPFILRGITLIGIDSQNFPMALREQVWNQLSRDWKPDQLTDNSVQVGLYELISPN